MDDLTEERRKRKRRDLATFEGRPRNILPHEMEEALGILWRLHGMGMSYTQLARQMGIEKSGVQKILGGTTRNPGPASSMRRETYEAVKALRYELPERKPGHRRTGAKMGPEPSRRRLRALNAHGYTQRWLAAYMGYDQRNLSRLILTEGSRYVYHTTAMEIAEHYGKLAQADPVDMGVPPESSARARSGALGRGYAPPGCWDGDTLDDPDAHPEWTGACGSEEGYRIHVRETLFGDLPLPLCAACKGVVETVGYAADDYVFDTAALVRLLKEKKLTAKVMSERTGWNRDTIYRWKLGERSPRRRSDVERLAAALEVGADDLIDHDATGLGEDRPAVEPGEFNPFFFRAAIAAAGVSFNELSQLDGVPTGQTLAKWARGENAPASKDKITPIARRFGVSREVFYQ